MEKKLSSWWKRIFVFLILFSIIYLPLDYFLRACAVYYESFYYYYDFYMSIFVALFISSLIIERNRSGKYFWTFGLTVTKFTLRDIVLSFSIVFIPFSLLIGFFYLLEINIVTDFNVSYGFVYYFCIIFFYSANEELFFRGIIFQAFIDKFGILFTILLSSLCFAIVHLGNYSFNAIALINTFLAGIVLGVMYVQTKSLYLSISFHFFWNFLQHFLLGSNISGNSFDFSIIRIDYTCLPSWLFGGNYGIEGGFVGTICLLLALGAVLWHSKPSPFITSYMLKRQISESFL